MRKTQKGFTIIEVALVLAIGALIFLVVFLAVPALQRNQRDDARKRDVSSVVDAVASFYGNAGGQTLSSGDAYDTTPKTSGGSNLGSYLDNLSKNTDFVRVVNKDADMTFNAAQNTSGANSAQANPYTNNIVVYTGAKCNGNTGIVKAAKRSNAIVVQVEAGGNGKYYCSDAS